VRVASAVTGATPPNMRVQRTRSSPSALRSPLTRQPLGGVEVRSAQRVAMLSLIVLSMSCSNRQPESTGLPPELVIPPGALQVSSLVDSRATTVHFRLVSAFPATDYLASVSKHLEGRGWKPLPEDWLNPNVSSSHVQGWTYFLDKTATPPSGVHQWLADWQSPSGGIVSYRLRYVSPLRDELHEPTKPTTDQLDVMATSVPAWIVKKMQARAGNGTKR